MLNKDQIRYLKALAHHLTPVVLMGAQGVNEGVDREIDRALNSHELIKVKLGNVEDAQQSAYIEHIVATHQAEFVQKIGHVAVFYRKNEKAPKIDLSAKALEAAEKKTAAKPMTVAKSSAPKSSPKPAPKRVASKPAPKATPKKSFTKPVNRGSRSR